MPSRPKPKLSQSTGKKPNVKSVQDAKVSKKKTARSSGGNAANSHHHSKSQATTKEPPALIKDSVIARADSDVGFGWTTKLTYRDKTGEIHHCGVWDPNSIPDANICYAAGEKNERPVKTWEDMTPAEKKLVAECVPLADVIRLWNDHKKIIKKGPPRACNYCGYVQENSVIKRHIVTCSERKGRSIKVVFPKAKNVTVNPYGATYGEYFCLVKMKRGRPRRTVFVEGEPPPDDTAEDEEPQFSGHSGDHAGESSSGQAEDEGSKEESTDDEREDANPRTRNASKKTNTINTRKTTTAKTKSSEEGESGSETEQVRPQAKSTNKQKTDTAKSKGKKTNSTANSTASAKVPGPKDSQGATVKPNSTIVVPDDGIPAEVVPITILSDYLRPSLSDGIRDARRAQLRQLAETKPKEIEFVALTTQESAVVDTYLKCKNKNIVFCRRAKNDITVNVLECLKDGKWINDEIVNGYFELIEERSKIEGYPKVLALSAFFYPLLRGQGEKIASERHTMKINIFDYDMILAPIHLQSHWALIVFERKNFAICYYDSSYNKDAHGGGVLMLFKDFIAHERKRVASSSKNAETLRNKRLKLMQSSNAPQQVNGDDCGVYMLKFADFLSQNKQLQFSEANISYFRRRIALEILQGHIMGA